MFVGSIGCIHDVDTTGAEIESANPPDIDRSRKTPQGTSLGGRCICQSTRVSDAYMWTSPELRFNMALFTRKSKEEPAPTTSMAGERLFTFTAPPRSLGAMEAFVQAQQLAQSLGTNRRLFLVLSGDDVDGSGRSGEWQFHYIYPADQVEAVMTVFATHTSPVEGSGSISQVVTSWPPVGSVQETMLQFQGPAARLIVEQQWNDRLERLPGLPEVFVDSVDAMAAFKATGADLDIGSVASKLKGRTPPGAYPVWEITTGFSVLQTPFSPR